MNKYERMVITTNKLQAVAYLRTSSATNVDGDSHARQLAAIESYAKTAGIEIVATFSDDAVKGDDAVEARPGFNLMLDRLLGNGVRAIIVETASRFARDLIVQEVGYEMLKARGIDLIAADSPAAFLDDGPTATLVRQMLGAVAQFEKAMLVSKLKGARDRKRKNTGLKVGGRQSHLEKHPEVVKIAKALHRSGKSYRDIGADLLAKGHANSKGGPFSPSSVANMLK
jgi:DNA invertase Pin-like site-specific DNA recombinase